MATGRLSTDGHDICPLKGHTQKACILKLTTLRIINLLNREWAVLTELRRLFSVCIEQGVPWVSDLFHFSIMLYKFTAEYLNDLTMGMTPKICIIEELESCRTMSRCLGVLQLFIVLRTDHITASAAARQNEKSFVVNRSAATFRDLSTSTFNFLPPALHHEGQTLKEVSQAYAPV